MEVAELAHLRRARDLLDREYARPLDVPVMARAALMSPSLFSRRFREAYGDTPYGYLQARRVERAMALLRGGRMSVTDVCIAVGFTSSPAQAMTSPAAMISLLDQPKLIHASLYFRWSPHTYGPYYDYAYRPFWKYRTPSLRYRCGCCC